MLIKQVYLSIFIKTEGVILSADLLQRISNADASLNGLRGEDYHLSAEVRINEQINRSRNNLPSKKNQIEIIAKMLNALKSSLKKTKTQNPEPRTQKT